MKQERAPIQVLAAHYMDTPKKSEWTAKDGWNYLKKLITRPEKSITIQEGLSKLNSRLILQDDFVVVDRNRQSQIFSGFSDDSVSIDFWENGIHWHSQSFFNISKVTLAAYLWNDLRVNSDEVEKEIVEIKFPESRKKIEISNEEYINWHWFDRVQNLDRNKLEESSLMTLLAKDEMVSKLMSFNSLWYFGLSSNIGNNGNTLKNDLPLIKIINEKFSVMTHDMLNADANGIASGAKETDKAEKAYKLLLEILPSNLDWAKYQTLEQFIERTEKSSN